MLLIIIIFLIHISLNTSFKWPINGTITKCNYRRSYTDYEQAPNSFDEAKKTCLMVHLNKYYGHFEGGLNI